MPSNTKENYLKALYFLSRRDEKISLSELSKQLEVSTPTVNSMVKKLEANGWVKYQKYKPIKLTDKGMKMASLIVRKHRLTEMFLVQVMGFGWEEVHDIAEEMEHIDSSLLFDRMDELLGYPTVDPHGSPIPDKQGKISVKEYKRLSQFQGGKKVRLCALAESSSDFLQYLNSKKIALGIEINIHKIEDFDQSMEVSYGSNEHITLSQAVTENLLVESL